MVRYGVNWYGSGEGPVVGSCEHGNDIEQRERERERGGGVSFRASVAELTYIRL
jgi:hypothetical protein